MKRGRETFFLSISVENVFVNGRDDAGGGGGRAFVVVARVLGADLFYVSPGVFSFR